MTSLPVEQGYPRASAGVLPSRRRSVAGSPLGAQRGPVRTRAVPCGRPKNATVAGEHDRESAPAHDAGRPFAPMPTRGAPLRRGLHDRRDARPRDPPRSPMSRTVAALIALTLAVPIVLFVAVAIAAGVSPALINSGIIFLVLASALTAMIFEI